MFSVKFSMKALFLVALVLCALNASAFRTSSTPKRSFSLNMFGVKKLGQSIMVRGVGRFSLLYFYTARVHSILTLFSPPSNLLVPRLLPSPSPPLASPTGYTRGPREQPLPRASPTAPRSRPRHRRARHTRRRRTRERNPRWSSQTHGAEAPPRCADMRPPVSIRHAPADPLRLKCRRYPTGVHELRVEHCGVFEPEVWRFDGRMGLLNLLCTYESMHL
jgi:hypothetical protein